MRTLLSALAAVLGLAPAFPAPAAPAPASSQAAPAAWTAYAATVNAQLLDWMAEESAPAVQLMSDLVKLQPVSRLDAPIRIEAKLWIEPDGRVARIEAGAGAGSALDADFAALVKGRRIATPPPADMVFPIRLRLAIKPPLRSAPAGHAG